MGGFDKVTDAVKRLLEDDRDARSYYRQGHEKLQEGEYGAAVEALDRAIERDPELVDAYVDRGTAKVRMGEPEVAIKDFERAVDLDGDHASARHGRGLAEMRLNGYAAAIADFTEAIDLDPDRTDSYRMRGLAKARRGDYEAAVRDLDEVLDRDPEDADAHYNRGLVRADLGEYGAAVEDFTRAVEVGPSRPNVYFERGIARAYAGDPEAAAEDYGRVIDLASDAEHLTWAHLNRAQAHVRTGNFGKAIDDARAGRRLSNSDGPTATSLLLEVVANLALDRDVEELVSEYRRHCEGEFTIAWSPTLLEGWLESSDLPPERRERIDELLAPLRDRWERPPGAMGSRR